MTTNRFIFIVGALIFLIPFVGFPRSWEEGFLILAGLVLMFLASLNIWQRSIIRRLKFHSKKLNEEDKKEDVTEVTETPQNLDKEELENQAEEVSKKE